MDDVEAAGRRVNEDPLTWAFVSVFGQQLNTRISTFEDLPCTHAWTWADGWFYRSRLLTKAQVVGIVTSIVVRSERVEYLIDDGTALVQVVRWDPNAKSEVYLGDLVRVEGKLNMDTRSFGDTNASREIRLIRMTKVEDPNEEILHWLRVQELSETIYSHPCDAYGPSAGALADESELWTQIAERAFKTLDLDDELTDEYVNRPEAERSDRLLVAILQSLLEQFWVLEEQEVADTVCAVSVRTSFAIEREKLSTTGRDNLTSRDLRRVFSTLRSTGLLSLKNEATDEHEFVTIRSVILVITRTLEQSANGLSMGEIRDSILFQKVWKNLRPQWIELSVKCMLREGSITQSKTCHRFRLT